MLSSLFRSKSRRHLNRSKYSSRHASQAIPAGDQEDQQQYYTEQEYSEDSNEDDEENYDEGAEEYEEVLDEDEDVNEDDEAGPLLPIFSAAHLDRLPVYNITHAYRLLIIQRCETTLSWDQLRSPQISQFMVKPAQQQIRSDGNFSRATLYALIANCLQFQREGQTNPGNVGVSKTRASLAELLAIRLLKEFSTRELIDALSYDFDPLQGFEAATPGAIQTPAMQKARTQSRSTRISTVEIAIKAQAKKFLSHPLVVQQLEAIWAGKIVFDNAADSLHRKKEKVTVRIRRSYGTIREPPAARQDYFGNGTATLKQNEERETVEMSKRRSVIIYNPRDASLFKLSRLRVPRYRQAFSTLSFAIMLGLFLAVLNQGSLEITALEVLFWFWSVGFMLDEIVGFTEQGFGLYIMSVWNAFDLGILLLFVAYYILRLYGILMPVTRKHQIARWAYDVLACSAVFLFPRLFSVLDHYRYFSQLLIAFRLMALDLLAVFILILISCSGFFVAFSLSFKDNDINPSNVIYTLFQILMGFTPAAWDKWNDFNILGKITMTLFLFICHFLVVTILITVLTNSFMAVVQNANEEHQFLFAVNTISMVKSDALFSYIAPTNVIGWLASPLRYVLPFRQFIKVNRTIIKVTHIPILFLIFGYERVILSRMAYDLTDFVEQRSRDFGSAPAFVPKKGVDLFSPGRRVREPSVATFRKDQALAEVFRRPFQGDTIRGTPRNEVADRRKSTVVVDDWMQKVGDQGGASPPLEEARSVLESLDRGPTRRRTGRFRGGAASRREISIVSRSVVSDPEERSALRSLRPHQSQKEQQADPNASSGELPQETDADGDDELVTNDEAENILSDRQRAGSGSDDDESRDGNDGYRNSAAESDVDETSTFTKDHAPSHPTVASAPMKKSTIQEVGTISPKNLSRPARIPHNRNVSSTTILFSPLPERDGSSSPSASPERRPPTSRNTNSAAILPNGATTPANISGRRTPKRSGFGLGAPTNANGAGAGAVRARPIMPPRHAFQSTPILAGFQLLQQQQRNPGSARGRARDASSLHARALDLASDLGDNRYVADPQLTGPASLSTQQMAYAAAGMRALRSQQQRAMRTREEREEEREEERWRRRSADEETGMVTRIMLTRMNALEEGFKDVLKEVKGMRSDAYTSSRGGSVTGSGTGRIGVGERPKSRRGKVGRMGSAGEVEKEIGSGEGVEEFGVAQQDWGAEEHGRAAASSV
ncbi:MAG: hypothetical protein M1821_000416 [Bathelium mastoideum]|nr:MAG: hypothetical protein M1821_000416 [Bathelium mastoideum]